MFKRCRYCKALVDSREFQAHRRRCYDQQNPRAEFSGSPLWKRLRKETLERDQYTCWCGAPAVEVDHVNGNWQDNRPENRRAVCAQHNPRGGVGDNAL